MKFVLALCLLIVGFSAARKLELVAVLKDPLFSEELFEFVGFTDSGTCVCSYPGSVTKSLSPAAYELAKFFTIDNAPQDRIEHLREEINDLESVETAYVRNEPELALIPADAMKQIIKEQRTHGGNKNKSSTPSFVSRQGYLGAPPQGLNAEKAWEHEGGDGTGTSIVDVEGCWDFKHEDLIQHNGRYIHGSHPGNNHGDHGTAVMGVTSGWQNDFGVTGVSHKAKFYGASVRGPGGGPRAISVAADFLEPGDNIIIELHIIPREIPGTNYIAMEWYPDYFAAMSYATEKGVIVVEAAGNGNENFDAAKFQNRPNSFPPSWKNPFRRSQADSGAILVGGGCPPPGTHGKDHGPDRHRLGYSNYGSALDTQGWGFEVTTTGYGDLQGGVKQKQYTDRFSGTSSSSPCVAGSVASISGMIKAQNRVLTPHAAREALRNTGSEQTDGPNRPKSQRIGNRPDILAMLEYVNKM